METKKKKKRDVYKILYNFGARISETKTFFIKEHSLVHWASFM